ncbi:MAG: TetR/AcrR family transcriptional regulator [Clostridia bacterium]|nr:TetR/AcrR family transcriptional regulator [Clostridia bacterium]
MAQQKERDKSKKRAAIMDGATDVFISMGYENASMDRIAEAANVSKRTVYNHFGSKENLFEVIVDDLLAQRQNLNKIKYDPDKSLDEQLISFAEAEIFLIDSPRRLELSRFLTITFLKDLNFQRKTVAKYPPAYSMLIEWLTDAKNDGRIDTDNIILAARIFYSMVVGAITWPALFSDGIDRKAAAPILNEMIAVYLSKYESNKK